MTRQIHDLRSWILVTVSFALGMLVADFIDYQWQAREDATATVVSQSAQDQRQP